MKYLFALFVDESRFGDQTHEERQRAWSAGTPSRRMRSTPACTSAARASRGATPRPPLKVQEGRRPRRLGRAVRRDEGAARRLLPARLQGPRRRARLGEEDPAGRAAASRSGPSWTTRPPARRSTERGGGAAVVASAEIVDRLFREESGRAVATLIRVLGDFDLAEEAVQDAFVVALEAGRSAACPATPAPGSRPPRATRRSTGIRRARAAREQGARARGARGAAAGEDDDDGRRASIPDERLRLIFTCCHPALAPEARVALTLRTLGGLQTAEIARAFLVAEPTMAQRLVRAKRKIRDAQHPLRRPARPRAARAPRRRCWPSLYLVFNEGYARQRRRRAGAARAVRRGDPPGAPAARR